MFQPSAGVSLLRTAAQLSGVLPRERHRGSVESSEWMRAFFAYGALAVEFHHRAAHLSLLSYRIQSDESDKIDKITAGEIFKVGDKLYMPSAALEAHFALGIIRIPWPIPLSRCAFDRSLNSGGGLLTQHHVTLSAVDWKRRRCPSHIFVLAAHVLNHLPN